MSDNLTREQMVSTIPGSNMEVERIVSFSNAAKEKWYHWLLQQETQTRVDLDKKTKFLKWCQQDKKDFEKGLTPDDSKDRSRAKKEFFVREDGAGEPQLWHRGTAEGDCDKRVYTPWELFNVIESIHESLGHDGINKTANAVHRQVYGTKKSEVKELLKYCAVSYHTSHLHYSFPLSDLHFHMQSFPC